MKVVIIGAGLTGLSTALKLQKSAKTSVLEKDSNPGGLSRTMESSGFRTDFAGHFLHFKNASTREEVAGLFTKEDLLEVERRSFIRVADTSVPYPFQSNIGYLPEDMKRKCLVTFLDNLKRENPDSESSFYAWMLAQYGDGIVGYFMEPYNSKMWTVHPSELTTEWMSRFVPRPSPEEIIAGTVSGSSGAKGYNAVFYYPARGIGELVDRYSRRVDNIITDCPAEKIKWKEKKVVAGEEEYAYDRLVSTVSLKTLTSRLLEPVPDDVRAHSEKLRANSVMNINLGWKGSPGDTVPEGAHWLYFPEPEYDFYRVGFYSNISPSMVPEGSSSCYVEVAYPAGEMPESGSDTSRKTVEKVIRYLKEGGIVPDNLESFEITEVNPIGEAYVIYDSSWEKSRDYLLGWLREHDIFCGGRYGAWEYSAMDDAIEWGEKLAERCLAR